MRVFYYLLVLVPSLVLASFTWSYLTSGNLYYCSDNVGPFDFIPPFIHPYTGDRYIAPAYVVWALLDCIGPRCFRYTCDCHCGCNADSEGWHNKRAFQLVHPSIGRNLHFSIFTVESPA